MTEIDIVKIFYTKFENDFVESFLDENDNNKKYKFSNIYSIH